MLSFSKNAVQTNDETEAQKHHIFGLATRVIVKLCVNFSHEHGKENNRRTISMKWFSHVPLSSNNYIKVQNWLPGKENSNEVCKVYKIKP